MQKYYKEKKLDRKTKKLVKKYLSGKEELPADGYNNTVTFPSGYTMTVSILLNSSNTPFCKAILRDRGNRELGEIKDEEYEGIWWQDTEEGDVYILEVK